MGKELHESTANNNIRKKIRYYWTEFIAQSLHFIWLLRLYQQANITGPCIETNAQIFSIGSPQIKITGMSRIR